MLRCDCGADALVAYGERWTCESCGRTYDTTEIPDADFRAIQDLRRRYRLIGGLGVFFLLRSVDASPAWSTVPFLGGVAAKFFQHELRDDKGDHGLGSRADELVRRMAGVATDDDETDLGLVDP